MSENQESITDVENIENKLKNFDINDSIDIVDKKLTKNSSIDLNKSDLTDTVVVDPAKNKAVEELNKIEVKDQVQTGELSRNNSIDGARNVAVKKPMSPFAKFRLLDRQNSLQLKSLPSSPSPSPRRQASEEILFKFTDPIVQDSAVQIKERLLKWCKDKTKDYENVKIENFSTSWNNGLAFCALIHHFRPDAFDYHTLKPDDKRKNFELAFTKADEVAGIFPLLDVEDMVIMRRPDWKCVFTYVQSIWRRFKDED